MKEYDEHCCKTEFWVFLSISLFLVSFAGITSGLALGLLSFSHVDLEILIKAGQPQDRKNAGWHFYFSIFVELPPNYTINYVFFPNFFSSLIMICSKDTTHC